MLTSYRALESQAKVIQNFVHAEPRDGASLKDSLADARDVNATIVQLDGALVALIGKVEEVEEGPSYESVHINFGGPAFSSFFLGEPVRRESGWRSSLFLRGGARRSGGIQPGQPGIGGGGGDITAGSRPRTRAFIWERSVFECDSVLGGGN